MQIFAARENRAVAPGSTSAVRTTPVTAAGSNHAAGGCDAAEIEKSIETEPSRRESAISASFHFDFSPVLSQPLAADQPARRAS